jgi:NADPH:quinone reductase
VSYAALTGNGGLIPGQTVLVHSAAGGLGSMAVQVAVAMGCRVLGTAGSPEKCASAKAFGASDCFNYIEDTECSNWWQKVLKATDSRGVDVVFDPVGLVDLSLKCTMQRGRIIIVGFAGREGNMEKIAMNRVLLRQVTLVGYVSFHLAPNSLTPKRLE